MRRSAGHTVTVAGAPGEAAAADPGPLSAALRLIDRAAEAAVVAALIGELAVIVANVVARAAFARSFLWSDEVAQFALSILAFVGGAVAYRRRDHASVRAVLQICPPRVERAALAFADVVVLFTAGLTGLASIQLVQASWGELTPILQIPAAVIALPLSIGMALLTIYAAAHLWREHGVAAWTVGLAFALILVVGTATQDTWQSWVEGDSAIVGTLVLFFTAILAGVPVGFVLLLATAAYLWATDAAPLVVVPQSMVQGTGNYILLAVPFFILAGLVMERGGISVRLVRFIHTLVGHMRGGLLQVTVLSMYVVSGLSGSKTADVAAVGTVMRDELRDRHGAPEGAAALAAAAIMGETVPPSIAMLIVGSITSVSVAAMFVGGLIPAAVMAACLMALIYIQARRAGTPRGARAPVSVMVRAGLAAILPLLMPAMLLAGILFGVATPTEIAALAVLYGLALALFVYREMDAPGLLKAVLDTAALAGMLLFIFAAASSFSWTLTVANLPQRLVALLQAMGNSAGVFMGGSIVLLVAVGVLLEGLPSLNVLAPLLIPIAGKVGLSEMHYALVLIIAMGIGGFMPMAGVGFYVCCAVMRCEIEPAARAMIPYLVIVLAGLLIVAFVPWFALALPRYFGFRV